MLLNSRNVAMGGLFTALAVICIFLSGALEINTLFFIVLAAYLMGTVLYITDLRYGLAAFVATLFLGFFLCPVKLYLVTFAACGIYVLCEEYIWKLRRSGRAIQKSTEWIIKAVVWAVCLMVGFMVVTNTIGWQTLFAAYLFIPQSFVAVAYVLVPIAFMILMDRVYIAYSMMVIRLLKLNDPGAQ